MSLYIRLYESLLDCCERSGFSRGFAYTVAMLVLGVGLCLNLLSIMNLLWTLHVLHHPYGSDGSVHPEHYVFALLYGGFIANTILARIRFTAHRRGFEPSVAAPGAAYVVASVMLFVVTLTLGLLTHR